MEHVPQRASRSPRGEQERRILRYVFFSKSTLPSSLTNRSHAAKIDQGNVALMSLAKQKQDMQDRFGPPLPTVEDAYGKHLAAMQKMQAIAAAGPSGGAAGPMMDHFERSGVPGQVDYDEDGVAHIPSSEEFVFVAPCASSPLAHSGV